jgi:hypothetical protein
MTIKTETDRKVALWERHGQTLMLAVITAALSYAGSALLDARTAQASMAAELHAVSRELQELRGAVSAMQLNYVSRAEFAVHEQRLQAVERRKP